MSRDWGPITSDYESPVRPEREGWIGVGDLAFGTFIMTT